MKQCPTCKSLYSDPELRYCLTDGSPLSAPNDSEPTVIIPASDQWRSPAATAAHVLPARPGVSPIFAYALVAILALLLGGGIVAWVITRPDANSPTTQKNESPISDRAQPSPATTREMPRTEPAAEATNGPPVEQQAAEPLTAGLVQSLLDRWVAAQNEQNFQAYQECYGPTFEGIKVTTKGSSQSYDFNRWMRDRRRMIMNAVNLNVQIVDLQITLNGNLAKVEFDQYYRSLRYSDHGPKVMTIQSTPTGAKIVYEQLKASYPL